MAQPDGWSDAAVDAFLEVQLQINAHHHLRSEHEHQCIRKTRMRGWCKLSSAVEMAQEVAEYGEESTENLHRNVEAIFDYA